MSAAGYGFLLGSGRMSRGSDLSRPGRCEDQTPTKALERSAFPQDKAFPERRQPRHNALLMAAAFSRKYLTKGWKKLSRPLKVGQELLETAKWLFAWSLRKGRIGRTNGSSIPWISEWACERTTTPIRHISQKEVNTNLKGLREWKSDKYSGGNKQKQKEQQRDANDLFNRKDWREKLHWKRWKNWQYLFFFFRIFVIVCLYNSIYKPFTCFSYFHHQTFFSNLDTGHDLSHVPSWAR